MGIEATGLDNLIKASYEPAGPHQLPHRRQEGVPRLDHPPAAPRPLRPQGKIHSDFERGFIRASVVSYDDLAACGYSMANVKAKGLQRTEGKEYVVQDGDIIEFLFNV